MRRGNRCHGVVGGGAPAELRGEAASRWKKRVADECAHQPLKSANEGWTYKLIRYPGTVLYQVLQDLRSIFNSLYNLLACGLCGLWAWYIGTLHSKSLTCLA